MFKVIKRIEISAMHKLDLNYTSECSNPHGHNWIITVEVKSQHLNENGMVFDFKLLKEMIHGKLDHSNLNEKLNFNPTAENIAKWVADTVDKNIDITSFCSRVTVQESEGNIAIWEK